MGNGIKEISMAKLDKTLKILMQTGEVKDAQRDSGRPAKLPGKRVSRTGNIYWETRKNRSDAPLKRL